MKESNLIGRIHSFESMGLVDGPGIRNIVFFQGCPLRCSFCHNPDTWDFNDGYEISSEELVKKIIRFKPYFKNDGGVTFSGGEPLMQPKFLLETLKLCKENNIHTAIDTSGYGSKYLDEILKFTDLVLLDIKHIDEHNFKSLTGVSINKLFNFIAILNKSRCRVWIRHVVVPGITDSLDHIESLKSIIKTIRNVDKIELLPYHTLGLHKYENLNFDYKLKDLKPMDKTKLKILQETLNKI
ncbi:pyruvate formate lyase-activating protein [Clostridium botulinum]|uniref:Pyruvate formate-lyase-activating enzyme n=1 Tax=Clostridium botulinum C/D str. DC5 TaxID=1443128 RepID=A0A0A0IGD0_CLOBO|nr:pyruvate formate-lyase-activating protein [Clostridium botulinum]KGM94082.1 pyruvate formate lyase-activating protein [Clostridium botulinum D str. CCUG 7971]KGN00043.1 pyruvate formate lyase-activating protein [Clostridium botulinum C/D str. DC5]KOC47436.1 pyruvate formate lyase-activating protein [Clostridium botulinum]KOC55711.1 pyruvate formate lyase-activating protein [Clostridium botulinum]KOC57226.1 pyruvate formate lyase-activating protein [Clostridium botulinum]